MFESFDALLLARLQFAFTVSFHFIFPAFSIGLASFLMVLEALWLKTGKGVYANLYRYWLKIFAITFAMGVVSGIVMSYQFGTNWSVFSDKAGPVIGPLMAYEVLTAFFLEAGFLGVMLFGINKVGRKLHFAATCMVALGTFISAFWILSVNSWMQTPTGFEMGANGQFLPGSSTPSSPPISRPPSWSARWEPGICCATVQIPARARCSRWRCGWRRSWRRSRFSSATFMVSIRWSISRPRSWRWKATIKAIPMARR